MLTKEQKDAFMRAKFNVSVVKRGRNQYAVQHPWREIDGPKTTTPGSWPYIHATQVCARLIAWEAMRVLGYDAETCESAIGDYPTGGALAVYKAALANAGPVEMEHDA